MMTQRQIDRADIAAKVKEFIGGGGVIQKLAFSDTGLNESGLSEKYQQAKDRAQKTMGQKYSSAKRKKIWNDSNY